MIFLLCIVGLALAIYLFDVLSASYKIGRKDLSKPIDLESNARKADRVLDQEIDRISNIENRNIDNLISLGPQEFETAICQLFRDLSYQVIQTPFSNDGGKDALLYRAGELRLLECKKYGTDTLVGRPTLQKFAAVISDEKAKDGIVVTTSKFTAGAIRYAYEKGIELIDGELLKEIYARTYPVSDNNTAHLLCSNCGAHVDIELNSLNTGKCLCECGRAVEFELKSEIRHRVLLAKAQGKNIEPKICRICGKKKVKVYVSRHWWELRCNTHSECKALEEKLIGKYQSNSTDDLDNELSIECKDEVSVLDDEKSSVCSESCSIERMDNENLASFNHAARDNADAYIVDNAWSQPLNDSDLSVLPPGFLELVGVKAMLVSCNQGHPEIVLFISSDDSLDHSIMISPGMKLMFGTGRMPAGDVLWVVFSFFKDGCKLEFEWICNPFSKEHMGKLKALAIQKYWHVVFHDSEGKVIGCHEYANDKSFALFIHASESEVGNDPKENFDTAKNQFMNSFANLKSQSDDID